MRWRFLWRTEMNGGERQDVFIYEPLMGDDVKRMKREGWRVIE